MKLLKISLFGLLLLLSGCIREDYSDCPVEANNVTINFSYTSAASGRSFSDYIARVDLMLFDESGLLVSHYGIDQTSLVRFPGKVLTLDPGTYKVLCWGNVNDYYRIPHLDVSHAYIGNMGVEHIDLQTGLSDNGDNLYYAPDSADGSFEAEEYVLVVPAVGSVVKTVDFRRAHVNLAVYVKGFTETTRAVGKPSVEINNVYGGYDGSMSVQEELMTYSQLSTETIYGDSSAASADFYVPLFGNDTGIIIALSQPSSGYIEYSVGLGDVLSDYGISMEADNPERIEILIEFTDTAVSVSLPGWNGTEVKPDID